MTSEAPVTRRLAARRSTMKIYAAITINYILPFLFSDQKLRQRHIDANQTPLINNPLCLGHLISSPSHCSHFSILVFSFFKRRKDILLLVPQQGPAAQI